MYERLKPYIPSVYFVIIAFILFYNNGIISLWDQDEAAYAGFARNMVTTGDWSVPQFMWSEIHRKPPLHFWNIALCYKVFGVNEFSVRFPSAVFVLLTYLLIYLAGAPLLGKKNAFIGAVVLSTTLFIPSLAKISVTDATLLFFSTLCAFSVLYVLERKDWRWVFAFWASFALAMLTKGPPIILFTAVFCGILFVFHPNRKNLLILHPWFFAPLACLPLFFWGYYVSQHDGGEFIQWMIDWYILKRVNGSVLGQTGPPGSHLLGIIVFFIPYLMFFPKAFWELVSGIFKKDRGNIFLLSSWFIAGWFLFEWSPSKLPAYVIVAHVPLALLIGRSLIKCLESPDRPAKGWVISHFVLMSVVFLALLVAPFVLDFSFSIKLYFGVISILLLTGLSIAFYNFRSGRFPLMLAGVNLFFQFAVWVILLPKVDTLKDASRRVANYVTENAVPASAVFIANDAGHPPSLPFYLGQGFDEVKAEKDMNILMGKFQSTEPCVLILNEEQKDASVSMVPQIKFEEVSSMMTDRVKSVRYFVAINESANVRTVANIYKEDSGRN